MPNPNRTNRHEGCWTEPILNRTGQVPNQFSMVPSCTTAPLCYGKFGYLEAEYMYRCWVNFQIDLGDFRFIMGEFPSPKAMWCVTGTYDWKPTVSVPFMLGKCNTKPESKGQVKLACIFMLFGAERNQGNSEKPLVKRLGPVYKSPTFTFACSWWSRGAPSVGFQVKLRWNWQFSLRFHDVICHTFWSVFTQFLISFVTVNGTI